MCLTHPGESFDAMLYHQFTTILAQNQLEGILVKLLYWAHIYSHLFEDVCHDVNWSIRVILYLPFLRLSTTGTITQIVIMTFLPSIITMTDDFVYEQFTQQSYSFRPDAQYVRVGMSSSTVKKGHQRTTIYYIFH